MAPEGGIIGARVELRSLAKHFGPVKAVDDLSFTAEPGSFLTILGPSGSGKSTTLNIIAGFESPTSGEVFLDSKPITSRPTYKRNIGMVFQNYALFPHMTVAENIAYPLEMRRLNKSEIDDRVRSALGMVQLEGYDKRYPKQLSGGQQQRVAIARALVFNPPLLLMDEPLGALDKKLREQMQIGIKRIQNQTGVTVIYVTHDQEEALVMSDRIVIMNHGRLQQAGSPEEIYDRPENRFVADFIGETNLFEGDVRQADDRSVLVLPELSAEFHLPSDRHYLVGQRFVSLRPEMIWLEAEPQDPPGLQGRIEELIYIGESTKYIIKVHDKNVTIKQPKRTSAGAFKRGDQVNLRFNPADLVFIESKTPWEKGGQS
ncbi:MAG: ABC transporter ATP-binding protein [Thermodesulfobacteriota bacterium]